MRDFVKRVTSKVSKLTPDQIQQLLDSLNEESEVLDAVFESLSVGLIICDSKWHPLLINKMAFSCIPLAVQNPAGTLVWELVEDEAGQCSGFWRAGGGGIISTGAAGQRQRHH